MSDTNKEPLYSGTIKIDPNYNASSYQFIMRPEQSEWKCYLFGNRPGSNGIVYIPNKGRVPNLFVRWMMRICLDSLWVKDSKELKNERTN